MAYRRRHGISRASTFKEEIHHQTSPTLDDDANNNYFSSSSSSSSSSLASSSSSTLASSSSTSSSSLAAQAIRASSAHRDSSLSSAYRDSAFASTFKESDRQKTFPATRSTGSTSYEYTSMKNLDEPKYGFWGVLAKKAKSILDDENVAQQFNKPGGAGNRTIDIPSDDAYHQSHLSPESSRKMENPHLQKGLDALTSSLNYIGRSFEEGLTIVENRTADIIQETRKLNIRKKGSNFERQTQVIDVNNPQQQIQMQTNQEMQLKASRDVAMAMTAKAKLLLRELKTVKADLAFAKERCNQLEEENRILRESHDKGDRPEDDDLIRLQLETLLAEKARLANENSIYARENRFLREIVEYHQLTMQDVVYIDEGIEEVSEVYPINIPADYTASPLPPPPTMISQAETKDIPSIVPKSVDTAANTAVARESSSSSRSPLGTSVSPGTAPSSSSLPVSAPDT